MPSFQNIELVFHGSMIYQEASLIYRNEKTEFSNFLDLCHQVGKEQSCMALFYWPVQLIRKKNEEYFQGF